MIPVSLIHDIKWCPSKHTRPTLSSCWMIRSTPGADCKSSWNIHDLLSFFCCGYILCRFHVFFFTSWLYHHRDSFLSKRWLHQTWQSILEKWISIKNFFERWSGSSYENCVQSNILCIRDVWHQVLTPRTIYLSNIGYVNFYCEMDTNV